MCRIMFSGESISMDTSLGEGGADTGWSSFSWRILIARRNQKVTSTGTPPADRLKVVEVPHLFSASSLSMRFHSLLTRASCSCSNVFSRSIFSRRSWRRQQTFRGRTATPPGPQEHLQVRLGPTCSRVSCLAMVSFSIFLIFFISLLTWNSCSCSKCCSSSAFSCCSWVEKVEEIRVREPGEHGWMVPELLEARLKLGTAVRLVQRVPGAHPVQHLQGSPTQPHPPRTCMSFRESSLVRNSSSFS